MIVMLDGDAMQIVAETALILNRVYGILVEEYGEESARKILVDIGRLAVEESEV